MGWHINETENTVKITDKCARELFTVDQAGEQTWYELTDVTNSNGTLCFNYDHMEHMDFLWNEDYQAVLKRHNVKGDICFSSCDGDNEGSNWGYRFDGEGGMVELRGVISWEERT